MLGLSSPYQQAERIRKHVVMNRYLRDDLLFHTKGGMQKSIGIHRRIIGFWMGGLQIDKVRESIRPMLAEFQESLVAVADQLFTGNAIISDPIRAQLVTHETDIANLTGYVRLLNQRIGKVEHVVFMPDDA